MTNLSSHCDLPEYMKTQLLPHEAAISALQLYQARKFKRWTQEMLARRIGTKQPIISTMERGWRPGWEPRWYEERIAKARRIFEDEEGGSLRFLKDGSVVRIMFKRI